MKNFECNSIASCTTDPPYNYEIIGQNWNTDEITRRLNKIKSSKSTLVKNIPYGNGLSGGVRNENWYSKNRKNILEYQLWIETWGKELYRILKPGSLALVFNSTRTIAHVQVALENVGFYARDIIVWRRNSGIPKGINISKKLEKEGYTDYDKWQGWHSCLRNEWEAISVVQKPLINNYVDTLKQYHVGLFNTVSDNGFQSNIIENIKREAIDEYNIHPTVKPLKLIEKLIDIVIPRGYGNIILDPFAVSGTTLLAAKNKEVDYIGIEINPSYIDIINKRLKKA
jgi:site-specific DNA-methyltransferase (adenine-specific)